MSKKFMTISIVIMVLAFLSCSKSGDPAAAGTGGNPGGTPTLTTSIPASITATTASLGGAITNQGSDAVSSRGVCYNTSPTPTISDLATSDGIGTGVFQSNVNNLKANTIYYARAYAINSKGTAYGNEITFTTMSLIATNSITNIRLASAVSGGSIINDGGATLTEKGICYSTSPSPTTSNNKISAGAGKANFTSNMNGLTANAKYYVRSYAVYNGFTTYGDEIVFTTTPGIGDTYQGGIVLYLLKSGDVGYSASITHGLIVSAQDIVPADGNYWWGPKVITGATGTSIGTGNANTQLIATNASTASNSVAKICYNLSLNGFSDWYLPSKDELYAIIYNNYYNGKPLNITGKSYWCSTEENQNWTPILMIESITWSPGAPKDFGYGSVRAVRSF